MAKQINKLILIGNAGNEPEIKTAGGGRKVATVSVGTGRQWRDTAGQTQSKTEWHRCVFWNVPRGQQLAELVEKMVHKGSMLYVEGRVEYREWVDSAGVRRFTTEVMVQDFAILSGKPSGTGAAPRDEDAPLEEPPEFE